MLDTITTGHALRRSRELAGMSERAAARALGIRRSTLRDWESDGALPDPDHVRMAAVVYGRGAENIWAERAPLVDPEQPGLLVVGAERISVWIDGVPGTVDNRDVIARYLAAVRRQRGLDEHHDIPLRADDLGALSMVLDLDDDQLQGILMELLDLTPAGAQWAIRSMLVGGLVAMVATGALGSSWFAPNVSAASSTDLRPPAAVAEVTVDDTTVDDSADVSVPGVAVDRDDDAGGTLADDESQVTQPIIEGEDVPVEISETPQSIEREQWDLEHDELGAQPADAAEPTTTFNTGVAPVDRAADRHSAGLPLFTVEHASREVVVDPPVFSVHAPSARRDLGAPLFAPVTAVQPPAAPGVLGPGPSALPPSFS